MKCFLLCLQQKSALYFVECLAQWLMLLMQKKTALGKIQDCSNEVGFDAKVSDLKLTVIYSPLTPTLRIHMPHSAIYTW